jgi:oligopeptide/dipeptide ABC transporter ATP-binding protein
MSLLSVRDLRVTFHTADGLVQAVRGMSFDVDAGQTLGIVGESGSGKTVCTQALLGLVPGADVSGQALFDGHDLLTMRPAELRAVRGARIAMIFQDPLSSLHPLYRVGWQIEEMIRSHRPVGRRAARARTVELLEMVGIPHAARRVDDYPHQFSGGMRQRVMIAMALALDPELIIADEPTTALDATVQAQIADGTERKRRVQELMELVGLNPEHYNRFPAEFSGGQRQRVGVARALAPHPTLVVCDEPVSALDVSIQAQILNLLQDLQRELGLTYLFIAHDLSVVEHVSTRVAVMYLGRIVELADAAELYMHPRHPYTTALLSAASVADPDLADRRQSIVLTGDVPSPVDPPPGCPFHPRCPKDQPVCAITPPLGGPRRRAGDARDRLPLPGRPRRRPHTEGRRRP